VRRRYAIVFLGIVLVALHAGLASADDGDPRFRLTTPRAALDTVEGALVIGIPGGRAWGIESGLRPLPPPGTTLIQLATADSAPVTAGQRLTVAVPIDPPGGAVSYRVRVLARLVDPSGRSADDAVTAVLRVARGSARPFGSFSSRLLE